jgi:hypothetical protein
LVTLRWQAMLFLLIIPAFVMTTSLSPRRNLHAQQNSVSLSFTGTPPTGPLRVLASNPRYFTDGSGKAILLAGSHTWFTNQDIGLSDPPPTFDYNAFLNFEQAHGHNFFRTFVWEQSWKTWLDYDGRVLPNIYERTGPGTALDGHPKFNLNQFNQAYFDRIRSRVVQAGDRGMYVSLQLFDDFSVQDKDRSGYSPYPGHPYNRANNINGIDGDPNKTGDGGDIHTLKNPAITALQEAYVRKLIDTVNDLDNVLFEICNESENTPEAIAWQNHFIDYIHSYETSKPKQHPVGFTVPYPNGNNADLFASKADWISPNEAGGYDSNPPVNDGRKVILTDTDHIWGLGGNTSWAWKSFTRGLNPIFMDPYDEYASFIWGGYLDPQDPVVVKLRANLGYILSYARRVNLAAMTPQPGLCSTGYCLANPSADNSEILVFLPAGETTSSLSEAVGLKSQDHKKLNSWIDSFYLPLDSKVTIDLSYTTSELTVEWFNPENGMIESGGTVVGGSPKSFIAPFTGDAVLYIYDASVLEPIPTDMSTRKPPAPTVTDGSEISTPTGSDMPSRCFLGLLPLVTIGLILLYIRNLF